MGACIVSAGGLRCSLPRVSLLRKYGSEIDYHVFSSVIFCFRDAMFCFFFFFFLLGSRMERLATLCPSIINHEGVEEFLHTNEPGGRRGLVQQITRKTYFYHCTEIGLAKRKTVRDRCACMFCIQRTVCCFAWTQVVLELLR